MPVGTQATIKGLLPEQVATLGAQIVLANTYHLMLRPGAALIGQMGGLHDWMGWSGPILTDSGGYQVFSLSQIRKINDQGVCFRSHLDGSSVELTPQRSIEVQNRLGADIIMAFDDCPPGTEERIRGSLGASSWRDRGSGPKALQPHKSETQKSEPDTNRVRQATERTVRWLNLAIKAHHRKADQALFGIVQGGTDLQLRSWCVQALTQYDLPGFAIGGVGVGERPELIRQVIEHTTPLLPEKKPRYLMGMGYERDILMAVRAGIDMFDCVLPTRNGRNASAFTSTGPIRLRNAKFAADPSPIEQDCDCPACLGFSRSFIRHLFGASEMLGPILVSMHNTRHFQRYLLDIRQTIAHNDWPSFEQRWPVASGQAG